MCSPIIIILRWDSKLARDVLPAWIISCCWVKILFFRKKAIASNNCFHPDSLKIFLETFRKQDSGNLRILMVEIPKRKKTTCYPTLLAFFKHQYFLLVTYIAGSNQKQIRVNYLDCIANISLNIHEQSMKHYIRKFSGVFWNWRQKCAFRHFSSSTQGSVVFINMSAPFCSDSLQSRCFEDKNWISQGQTGHNTYIANGRKTQWRVWYN